MLEEFFILNQRMNLSISECKKLPVTIRKWYIQRIIRSINSQSNQLNSLSSTENKNNSTKNSSNEIDINKVGKFFSKFN